MLEDLGNVGFKFAKFHNLNIELCLKNVKSARMEHFSELIRSLMDQRELTGVQLAKEIKLSATSVSKIVTGQSKPRQVTLTRLIKTLCIATDEEQRVISAYDRFKIPMTQAPDLGIEPTPEDEIERVTHYMEVKSMSIAFKQDVESVLKDAGIDYHRDYRADPYICDFHLILDDRRIAIECKYNVNRDWDRAITSISLLRENLPCDEVIIVVPYENKLAEDARANLLDSSGRIATLEMLKVITAPNRP